MLPSWNEISQVTRYDHFLREIGVWLLAGGVVTELIALFSHYRWVERRKRCLEVIGICFFLLLATVEYFEILYSDQRDLLLNTPRLLTSADQLRLARELAPLRYEGVAVFWVDHDFEAADFGESIMSALKQTKHSSGAGVTEGNDPDAIIQEGLSVEVPDIHHPGIAAQTLFAFFTQQGYEPRLLQTRAKARLQDQWVQLRIRRKPRS
jgi:hypothetical protein